MRPIRLSATAGLALCTTAALVTTLGSAGSSSAEPPRPVGQGGAATVQLLSFNDYHGHLEANDPPLSRTQDPAQTAVGGAEYLSSTLDQLRSRVGDDHSLTVAAGDLIGGSTFLSGLFHDEPSVETLEAMDLDVSSVGNHEFDEGTDELLRMQDGGCHPADGCYFPDDPYDGADFEWLAANVVRKDNGQTLLPGTSVKEVDGVDVGFIGMTLEDTPTLVNPEGVSTVEFRDEVETANAQAKALQAEGVEAIVVLLHEGGSQAGNYGKCVGISGPIVDIATNLDPAVDAVVTGHTHEPYVCSIPDPAGAPRSVTSAASFGRVVTETVLMIDRETGDVLRERTRAKNHLVRQKDADPEQTAIIAKWKEISDPLAARVVGSVDEDITGDASGDRGIETPMADLVADAILWGTSGDAGGAQVAFMNVGGVRDSFRVDDIAAGEQPGEITYSEAFDVAPFGNLLVTMDLTGAQIKELLEQQFIATRGRQQLALGVSEGFSYTWDGSQPEGQKVVAESIMLNDAPVDPATTYRVATLNFLAAGGDQFTVFTEGTNVLGGAEDLANLVDFLLAHPGLTPPEDRVSGL